MQQVELIVALLAVVGIVGAISQKLRIALPILLVVTGMVISLIPQIPDVRLDPDVIFFIFLPPLLYLDAFNTSWKELKDVAEVITLQAIGLVLATVAGVAVAIHAVVPGMPWTAAFVLGAIVSPTDAVAASAIAKEVNLPKKLMDIIKGESLVNDSTGLVAYQFAVAATVTGIFSLSEAGRRFLIVGLGGIALGLALGWVLSKVRTKLDHRPVEIIVSLLTPFIAYLTAEHLHVSGILSVVTAGLLLGWHGPKLQSSQTRLQATATWETIGYILNGFSFLLMGLQLEPILETVKSYSPDQLLLWTATAAFAPIVIRFAWTFSISPIYSLIKRQSRPSWKHLFVLSWSGTRGVVSLAAALALPLTTASGQEFPYRDLLIFLTIVVIASTLLLQGLTLPAIVRKFGFTPDLDDSEEVERKARLALSREAVRTIDEVARARDIDLEDPTLQKILNRYLERAIANIHPDSQDLTKSETWRLLLGETVNSQRRLLVGMRDSHEIGQDVFRTLQNELDLEEAQLNGPPGVS